MWEIKIKTGSTQDGRAVGELYLKCFPASSLLFFNYNPTNMLRVNILMTAAFTLTIKAAAASFLIFDPKNTRDLLGYCIVSTKDGLPLRHLFAPGNIGSTMSLCWTIWRRIHLKEIFKLIQNSLRQTKKTGQKPSKKQASGRIISIAVDPKAQGLGLGKALLKEALNYLEENKIIATYLEVRPQNTPARKMYEHMGFYPYGTSQDSQGSWLRLVRINKSQSPL